MAKVKDQGYKKFTKSLREVHNSKVQVGAVGQHAGESLSNAELLAIHEFGTKSIPARAPIRKTFRDSRNMKTISSTMQEAFARNYSVKNGYNLGRIQEIAGITISQMVKATISRRLSPANAESTLKKKKGDLPLVNTRQLFNSIDYGVVK